MPFAYITQPGTTLRKRGRTIILCDGEESLMNLGLTQLDSLILRGNIHLSTPALRALLANDVNTTFLSSRGRLLGHLTAPKPGNVALRLAQYHLQDDRLARRTLARECVLDKIEAVTDLLARYAGNYPNPLLKIARQKLQESARSVNRCETIEALLGVEGNAAAVYWTGFRQLNRSDLGFFGRSRRPPRDEINAVLSLGYVLLTNEIRGLAEALGFDPFLGFYHELKSNRPSLALDLVEPFRHLVVDRVALRLANLGQLKAKHFSGGEDRGFRLTPAGWKVFLTEYEERMLATPAGAMADRYPHARSWRELLRKHCLGLRRQLQRLDLPEPSHATPSESPP